jgi:hypothetical protein
MDDWNASATSPAAANGQTSNPASPVTLTQASFFMDDTHRSIPNIRRFSSPDHARRESPGFKPFRVSRPLPGGGGRGPPFKGGALRDVDPDHANGSLEWELPMLMLVATVTFSVVARLEWVEAARVARRAQRRRRHTDWPRAG